MLPILQTFPSINKYYNSESKLSTTAPLELSSDNDDDDHGYDLDIGIEYLLDTCQESLISLGEIYKVGSWVLTDVCKFTRDMMGRIFHQLVDTNNGMFKQQWLTADIIDEWTDASTLHFHSDKTILPKLLEELHLCIRVKGDGQQEYWFPSFKKERVVT